MTNEREFTLKHFCALLIICAAFLAIVISSEHFRDHAKAQPVSLNAQVYRVDPASVEAERMRREQPTIYAAGVNDGMRELMLLVIQAQRKNQPIDWKQATTAVKSYLETQ